EDHKSDDVKTIENWIPDDGSGKVKVYRVEHDTLVRVSTRAHGIFFSRESYVIRYRLKGDDDLYIIYIWQVSTNGMYTYNI
ncbi:hypothetical protein LSH36_97g01013, partial [Paralvinella palmiformis]